MKDPRRALLEQDPASPAPDQIAAIELWCWYQVTCEAFDRTVCTAPMRHGAAMPATLDERSAITKHAMKVRDEVTRVAEARGISAEVMKAARREVGRWSDARQAETAARATWVPWAVREACGYASNPAGANAATLVCPALDGSGTVSR